LKKEDIDKFFSQYQNQPSSSTIALAKTGNASSSNSWIIDFGATDHLTSNPNIFTSWNQLSQKLLGLWLFSTCLR
jgi:hypothetical protein